MAAVNERGDRPGANRPAGGLESCFDDGSRFIRRTAIDEDGGINWGAFDTVDFERTVGKFDMGRYEIDKRREERRNVKILIDTIRYHVRDANKYVVLRYALRGIIDIEDILDAELKGLVRLYRRVRLLG